MTEIASSPGPSHEESDPVQPQIDEQPAPPSTENEPSAEPKQEQILQHPAQEQLATNGINSHTNSPKATDHLEKTTEFPTEPASELTIDSADHMEIQDGRPTKRRRIEATPPPSARKKVDSPPWKRAEAEGPTSFTQNGRRKSGRINTVPLELQPQGRKRITRGALHDLHGSPPAKTKHPSTNGNIPVPKSSAAGNLRSAAPPKPPQAKPTTSNKGNPKGFMAHETKAPSRALRKRTPSPSAQPTRQSTRSRRPTRHSMTDGPDQTPPQTSKNASTDSPNRTPRIRLRVRPTTIPLVHHEQANAKPRLATNFEEYWERAHAIPAEEGGLFASEDGPLYTDEMAKRDAQIIMRIEEAAEPGGILSEGRSSVFVPGPAEEPPRQWAQRDHMVKAMANFRKLLLAEQQRHRTTAKRLAEACREEYIRRQPKTEAQLEEDRTKKCMKAYHGVIKVVGYMWDNVRAEVNRRRLEEWEIKEQKRVKAALNEAVNISEQMLQAQRAHLDSDAESEEDEGIDDDLQDQADDEGEDSASDQFPNKASEAEGSDDDNMTSSDESEDQKSDLGDEGLSPNALRAKYAGLGAEHDTADTSDESVDMDDDLSSTDMDSDDEDESGGSESDEQDGNDEPSGLLGMLFAKKELRKLNEEAQTESNEKKEGIEDTDMSDGAPAPQAVGDTKKNVDNQPTQETDPVLPIDDGHEDEVLLVTHPKTKESCGDQDTSTEPIRGPETSGNIPSPNGEVKKPLNAVGTSEHPLLSVVEASASLLPIEAPCKVQSVPGVEITAPSSDDKVISPETNPVTNPPSPERSQSPRTSETKPSEVDSSSSTETTLARNTTSRSASPQPSTIPKTEVPFLLRGTLREYQHYGLDWLAGLYANNTNGILADEMGLGKTIQTIALLAHLACQHEVWGPHLVIVPTSVMLNWEMEFKKWCPGFKILAYYGTQEERKRKRQGWNNDDVWNVCITSYQLVLQDQQVFKRRKWHYMILDEAHNIKNFKSQRWQTLLGFNTHSRLLLTGTPLQNNLTELWSLLFFLMPSENGVGGFADLQEFHDWFHKPESQILESGREKMDDEARAIISKLHKVLRPYLLRRLKADVEKQMPAKYEHVEFCRLSKRQRELYDGFLARTDTRDTLSSGNYLSIINCLMQLRKVCNHPDLFVDRPIMTSFRMDKSVPFDYDTKERVVRRLLAEKPMSVVNIGFLNLIPAQHEVLSSTTAERISQLSSHRVLMDLREAQKARAQFAFASLDPATVQSNIIYLESAARWGRFEELQHCVYLNALRRQQRPIYGKGLVDFLTLGVNERPQRPRPKVPRKIMAWFEEESVLLKAMVPTLDERAASLQTTIQKFACVTPAVVTRDMDPLVLGDKGVEAFEQMDLVLSRPTRWTPFMPKEPPLDPWHESRMRLSIQFPDKRLLQYDCGKLQALDKLLRKLQAGGHRALIFTQMTKVLDILEQFLNIHGHKYLRLDGATKVEQRQILTDRFNHDTRILCFILSTRSGGLGINLTGADTVIFYDQDWNPAMDKQCQDRCHRIGQTRDVHIYRLVSEHTIEANILRKASQKQMLDDVVIQEGEFTTDYFNKLSVRDVIGEEVGPVSDGNAAANAAMDRVLGGADSSDDATVGRVLEQAEDREDVAAARVAEKEIQADDADFDEKANAVGSGTSSARQGTPKDDGKGAAAAPGRSGLGLFSETAENIDDNTDVEVEHNAWGERMRTIDDYMVRLMSDQLAGTVLEIPKDKKKSKKKGKDTRKR
jgi:helicase SWR1